MQFVWLGRVTDFPCQEKAAADGDAAPSTAKTSGLTGSSKSQTLAFCQDLPMQADIKADGGAVLLVFHSLRPADICCQDSSALPGDAAPLTAATSGFTYR